MVNDSSIVMSLSARSTPRQVCAISVQLSYITYGIFQINANGLRKVSFHRLDITKGSMTATGDDRNVSQRDHEDSPN